MIVNTVEILLFLIEYKCKLASYNKLVVVYNMEIVLLGARVKIKGAWERIEDKQTITKFWKAMEIFAYVG